MRHLTWLAIAAAVCCGTAIPAGCGGSAGPDGDVTDGDTGVDGDTSAGNECTDPDGCYELPYMLHGRFDPSVPSDINIVPYPYDYFTRPDPSTPTGLRQNLAIRASKVNYIVNTRTIDKGLGLFSAEKYVRALNRLDGFSTAGYLLFETGERPADGLFSDDPAVSLSDASPVHLLDIDPASPGHGRRVAFRGTVREGYEFENDDPERRAHLFWYVTLMPDRSLRPATRHAVVVNRGLVSEDGRSPVRSAHFRQVWGIDQVEGGSPARQAERDRLASLPAALQAAGVADLSQIVLAWDVTTHSSTSSLDYVTGPYLDAAVQTPPDFDYDLDTVPNLYPPADWPEHLPRLSGSLGDTVGLAAAGRLTVPEWRHDQDDPDSEAHWAFVHDDDFRPVPNGENELDFFLFYPKDPRPPLPLVMTVHGINNRKEGLSGIVRLFTGRGAAVIMFDLPFHGTRRKDYPPLDFIDVLRPSKAAASFMQAASEHAWIVRAVQNGLFDLLPDGRGDGAADFDPDRIGYFGNSLGAIIGGMSVALSDGISVANLNVGGSLFIDYVEGFLNDYGLVDIYPDYYVRQFAAVAQTVLDPGDAANFSSRLNDRHAAGRVRFFCSMAMEDETIPFLFSLNFLRIGRLDHLGPVHARVPDTLSVAGPYSGGKGFYQFGGASHDFLFGSDSNGVGGRAQVEEFFATFFETGQAVLIDPLAE